MLKESVLKRHGEVVFVVFASLNETNKCSYRWLVAQSQSRSSVWHIDKQRDDVEMEC